MERSCVGGGAAKEWTGMGVHDGKRTLFWRDAWLGPKPLIEEARGIIDESHQMRKVVEYLEEGAWWR